MLGPRTERCQISGCCQPIRPPTPTDLKTRAMAERLLPVAILSSHLRLRHPLTSALDREIQAARREPRPGHRRQCVQFGVTGISPVVGCSSQQDNLPESLSILESSDLNRLKINERQAGLQESRSSPRTTSSPAR